METIQSAFGHEYMSKVQHRVLSKLPTDRDLLVKAKTGTGKTLAFLVAALESLMANDASSTPKKEGDFKMGGGNIGCVIIAPTRELALQISDEANKLLEPLGWGVQYLVGGESKTGQLDRISKEASEFVVATPGRLKDLLGNTEFAAKVSGSKVLVLDEADTMLQLGFRKELDSILKAMPQDRQTFLFSATVDSKLDSLLEVALHRETKTQKGPIRIDTVGAKEINLNLDTHQRYCLAPYHSHVALVRRIINDHLLSDMDFEHELNLAKPKATAPGSKAVNGKSKVATTAALSPSWNSSNNKIIVFLPTTRSAQLYARVFASLSMGRELSVFEIHSAKDQRQRSLTSRNFRKIKSPAVLFTSDISARGVDYPGVGLVVQVGAPLSLDHYIHRVGRTGRGNGKNSKDKNTKNTRNSQGDHGKGILILGELDQGFIEHQLQPSPLCKIVQKESKYEDWESVMLGENLDRGYKKAISKVDEKLAKNLTVGPRIGSTDRRKILESADKYIGAFGVEERPAISTGFLERMGFMKYQGSIVEGEGEEQLVVRQPHEYELVDGTFPTINTRITKSPYASSSSLPSEGEEIDQDLDSDNNRQMEQKQSYISRKKRQEEFEERVGLADTEYVKVNEDDWEDFMEFKPGMPKLIEKLHNPKRLGQVGNRPRKAEPLAAVVKAAVEAHPRLRPRVKSRQIGQIRQIRNTKVVLIQSQLNARPRAEFNPLAHYHSTRWYFPISERSVKVHVYIYILLVHVGRKV
ncbi:hypothetical protein BGZ76_006101 [Entomortierella beljakovae]|nr:hypothetical protein BGZ76_006101 [Entomortierella beljakovae]